MGNSLLSNNRSMVFDEILDSMEKAEKRWTTFILGFWTLVALYKINLHQDQKFAKETIGFLPADQYRDKTCTNEELYNEMVPKGKPSLAEDINLQHLVTMFSLLEALADEAEEIMVLPAGNDAKKYCLDKSKSHNLINFLLVTKSLEPSKLPEFCFARETRNCFIHKNGKFDDRACSEYKKCQEIDSNNKLKLKGSDEIRNGDEIREKLDFKHYQKFCRMILEIGKELEKHVK